MGTNPDRTSEVHGGSPPSQGDLRFIEKEVDNHGTPALRRILQRWEWSYEESKWGWYDVPLVEVS